MQSRNDCRTQLRLDSIETRSGGFVVRRDLRETVLGLAMADAFP